MVKERRVGLGSTNLAENSTSTSWSNTHKLITPVPYSPPKQSTVHRRKIDDASSFRPGKIYVRDFHTAYADEFKDPATLNVVEYGLNTEAAQKAWEESRRAQRTDSLKKLGGLAKNKFGNLGNMMRAFKKNTGDSMSIVEFSEHLRRRNLDALFPAEDQDLVYEALKSSEPALDVPTVGSMLKLVNEADPTSASKEINSDMLAMREFLAEAVANRAGKAGGGAAGAASAASAVPAVVEKHYSREEEHAELMRKAVGQKTFGIAIKAEDMDEMVNELNQKHGHGTDKLQSKFSRFLRVTNIKLHAAPFYDMRNDTLEYRKKLVVALDDQSSTTRDTLAVRKQAERDALDTVLNRSITLTNLRHQQSGEARAGSGGTVSSAGALAHSLSSPVLRSGGLSQYSSSAEDTAASTEVAPASTSARGRAAGGPTAWPQQAGMSLSAAATPIKGGGGGGGGFSARKPPARNLAGNEDELGALQAAARLSINTGSHAASSGGAAGDRTVGISPDATMLQQSPSQAGGGGGGSSSSSISISSSSFGGAPLAADFTDQRMRLEKPRTPEQHVGKRSGDASPSRETDWYRIGHGGNVLTPRNVKGLTGEAEYRGRYKTTNGDYYPPLLYRPSMPVTRELISDADARVAMQADRRQRRHNRLSENLAVTQRRVERERLENEAREIRRCQKVNDDMINYSTTVFLNDLKSFKKQPLQMMMRKPNLTKSDLMWGGTLARSREDDRAEAKRDFSTTYSGSFASPEKQGAILPTLVLEDRVSAIFGRDFSG